MMTVPMDNSSTTSSWDHAQDLFKKNIELENGLRKSAQAKIPSDPNVWLQMRENYEAIILEDHEFSEKYEVEYMLWQLHYRRIEEFRLHINAAKSAGTATQSGRSPTRPDRIKKIRSAFKSFLSESTGFYHDLILKIRAKYGLPLGYFSEGPESQIILSKDEKKSSEMKKGLLSCHRCLIYLGDLARYKGMYGEGDSVTHEFTAASSYYMQAASLCPSSGNPHHQLAILASYSNDDLVTIYRYFRSLAVDNPFSTARDNLIIAFEKNRQRIAQIPAVKTAASNVLPPRATGKGRGRGDGRITSKECNIEPPIKEQELTTTLDIYKSFSTRFVRLHGILFTRTSLETFGDVFSSVTSDLHKLLAAGMEEVFNFGVDASENGLIMVRLVSILIFTVHNVNNRDASGQSYAEILQRSALLQNAFSACFEFVGHMLKRCAELRDVSSSFLLPGIMVFVEWLACHPDIATGFDVKEKQAAARMFFWDQCVSFMNALLLSGHGYADAYEDETCFSDMGYYEEGETGNRLALWEDFELRGFVPLMRAHLILDFSRKHSMGSSDGSSKEVRARVQRIFAAGRALMNVVKIDQQGIYFDRVRGKFVFGIESLPFSAVEVHSGLAENMNNFVEGLQSAVDDFRLAPAKSFLHADDEEEEEIVFQPTAVSVAIPTPVNAAVQPTNGPNAAVWPRSSAAVISPPLPPFLGLNINAPSTWPLENEAVLSEGFRSMNIENGFSALHFASGLLSTDRINAAADAVIPSPLDSIVMPAAALTAGLPATASSNLLITSKRNPVSRPVRHVGPPPGFGHTSFNKPQLDSGHFSLDLTSEQIHDDDYSWLDDYQPSSNKAMAGVTSASRALVPSLADCNDVAGFPFPGKQIHPAMMMMPSENKWQDFRLFEHHLKPFSEERIAPRTNFRPTAKLPEQLLQAQQQPTWSASPYLV